MDEPYQPPAADSCHEEEPPSIRKRRAGPVARFLSAATILIAIALAYKLRGYPTFGFFQPDGFLNGSPQLFRILLLDYPYAVPGLAVILATLGGAVSYTRNVFLGLGIAVAATVLLASWAAFLVWVLMDLIKGMAG